MSRIFIFPSRLRGFLLFNNRTTLVSTEAPLSLSVCALNRSNPIWKNSPDPELFFYISLTLPRIRNTPPAPPPLAPLYARYSITHSIVYSVTYRLSAIAASYSDCRQKVPLLPPHPPPNRLYLAAEPRQPTNPQTLTRRLRPFFFSSASLFTSLLLRTSSPHPVPIFPRQPHHGAGSFHFFSPGILFVERLPRICSLTGNSYKPALLRCRRPPVAPLCGVCLFFCLHLLTTPNAGIITTTTASHTKISPQIKAPKTRLLLLQLHQVIQISLFPLPFPDWRPRPTVPS